MARDTAARFHRRPLAPGLPAAEVDEFIARIEATLTTGARPGHASRPRMSRQPSSAPPGAEATTSRRWIKRWTTTQARSPGSRPTLQPRPPTTDTANQASLPNPRPPTRQAESEQIPPPGPPEPASTQLLAVTTGSLQPERTREGTPALSIPSVTLALNGYLLIVVTLFEVDPILLNSNVEPELWVISTLSLVSSSSNSAGSNLRSTIARSHEWMTASLIQKASS